VPWRSQELCHGDHARAQQHGAMQAHASVILPGKLEIFAARACERMRAEGTFTRVCNRTVCAIAVLNGSGQVNGKESRLAPIGSAAMLTGRPKCKAV